MASSLTVGILFIFLPWRTTKFSFLTVTEKGGGVLEKKPISSISYNTCCQKQFNFVGFLMALFKSYGHLQKGCKDNKSEMG